MYQAPLQALGKPQSTRVKKLLCSWGFHYMGGRQNVEVGYVVCPMVTHVVETDKAWQWGGVKVCVDLHMCNYKLGVGSGQLPLKRQHLSKDQS